MSTRKPHRKRRHGGKLRSITDEDRDKRIAHDTRTGRLKRVFDKKKVIPSHGSKSINDDKGPAD